MKTSKKIISSMLMFSIYTLLFFVNIYAFGDADHTDTTEDTPECKLVIVGEDGVEYVWNEERKTYVDTVTGVAITATYDTSPTKPTGDTGIKVITITVSTSVECDEEVAANPDAKVKCNYSMENNESTITGDEKGYDRNDAKDNPMGEGRNGAKNGGILETPGILVSMVNYCREVTVQYKFNPYVETVEEKYDCKDVPSTTSVDEKNDTDKTTTEQECQTRDKDVYGDEQTRTITVYGNPKANNGDTIHDFNDTKKSEETLRQEAFDMLLAKGASKNNYITAGLQSEKNGTTDSFNLVYSTYEECVSASREFIVDVVRGKLKEKEYYSVQQYYSMFMSSGMFQINCLVFKPDTRITSAKYSFAQLFVHANSTYGYIFQFDKFKSASSLEEAMLYAPKIVKAEAHITDLEATGKHVDRLIYEDNLSADTFIMNTTNPDSQYYNSSGKAEFLHLNDSKFTKFNAIRAKSCSADKQYIAKVGTKIVLQVNEDWAEPLTSKMEDAYGTNIIYSYAYADQWYQRLFQIEETWSLMFYICNNDGSLTDEYTGLYFDAYPNGECNKVYRALFNVYADDTNSTIHEFRKTNEGLYNLKTGAAINDNYLIRVVAWLVSQKFGSPVKAMEDITDLQRRYTSSVSGHNRGALYTSYATAGTISYDNGKNKVNYKLTPKNLKPLKANGITLGQAIDEYVFLGYSITDNGIYVKAQAQLTEWQVGVYNVEPIVSTFSTSHTTREVNKYSICVGQYHCDCQDINVLCSCEDEEMGCGEPICLDIDDPACDSGYDCDEDPTHPKCDCFDDNPSTDCKGRGWIDKPSSPTDITTNDPGGKTGGGAAEYFERYYKPSSSLTN